MAGEDIREALRQLHGRGREAWPEIDLDGATFATLAVRSVGGGRYDDVRAGDLYLAMACAVGLERALAMLDRHYLSPLPLALIRRGYDAATASDVVQAIRVRFLVGTPRSGPRIARYDGRGSLATWLRVAAHRMAISASRKGGREVLVEELDLMATAPGPELGLLQQRFEGVFAAEFRRAFAALTPRERNLLRYQFVDQLGIDRIAAIHGVHRATAARWLVQAREALRQGVRRGLQESLLLEAEDLDDLVQLLESKLELSLRLLATPRCDSAGRRA